MEWWQQMIEAGELTNPLGLSEEVLDSLAKDFIRLEIIGQRLPKPVLRYVVDGSEGESILDEVTQSASQNLNMLSLSKMSTWEKYHRATGKAKNQRKQLFKLLAQQSVTDVDFYCRLAKVYSTEAQIAPMFGLNVIPFGKSANFDPFLKSAAGTVQQTFQIFSDQEVQSSFNVAISFDLLEEMLESVGENPEVLVKAVFPDDYYVVNGNPTIDILAKHPQFATFALKHLGIVQGALNHKEIYNRTHALKILSYATCKPLVEATKEKLIEMAIGSSKVIRQQAEALFKKHRDILLPELKQASEHGKAAERFNAINLLETLKPEDLKTFLEQRKEQEKSDKVRGAIEKILTVPIAPEEVKPKQELQLPPLPAISLEAPLPDHVYEAFKQMIKECDQAVAEYVERMKEMPYSGYSEGKNKFKPTSGQQIEQLWQVLQSGKAKSCYSKSYITSFRYAAQNIGGKSILGFLATPELELIHLVRFLLILDELSVHSDHPYFGYHCLKYLNHYRNSHSTSFGFRELANVLKLLGLESDPIRHEMRENYHQRNVKAILKWGNDALWPYFAENIDILTDIFTPKVKSSPYDYEYGVQSRREIGLEILETFPTPPAELEPKLWEIALGGSKKEAPIAQNILAKLPDFQERVLVALGDRSNVTGRIAAAQCLERVDGEAAIAPIKKALKAEKNENAKDVYMRILSRLGVSATEFINIKELKQEADKGLKKGIPDKLSWFPFKQMPMVHWQDSGKPVEKEILTWFIVKAHKQKLVEPSPIVQLYSSYFKPDDREQFGQFVLESWVAHDTRPLCSQPEAEKKAKQDAASIWSSYQQQIKQAPATREEMCEQIYQEALKWHKQWHQKDPDQSEKEAYRESAEMSTEWRWNQIEELKRTTKESLYRSALSDILDQLAGSATKDKGVLAIASACCGVAAVPVARDYLTKWYGRRSAQCIALLQVLTWVEDFSAIQYLLSVAKRFRSKNIQEAAGKFINEIAERNGWTRDELGDRTIPYCRI
jgi:hypothetical protein